MYGYFNLFALCSLVTHLRNGVSCFCDPSQHPLGGSFNWAVCITFEDGVQWLFRCPRDGYYDPPRDIRSTLLASEAATLKYVKTNSNVPVPEVYAYWEVLNVPL